jgi:hypothetical protein
MMRLASRNVPGSSPAIISSPDRQRPRRARSLPLGTAPSSM